MENCVIQEITYIDELKELCLEANKINHQNALGVFVAFWAACPTYASGVINLCV